MTRVGRILKSNPALTVGEVEMFPDGNPGRWTKVRPAHLMQAVERWERAYPGREWVTIRVVMQEYPVFLSEHPTSQTGIAVTPLTYKDGLERGPPE